MARGKKSCTTMLGAELRKIRETIGFDIPSMIVSLGGMGYRTYQGYERDERSIPPEVATTAREVLRKDRETMERAMRAVNERLDRDYPNGIMSDPIPE